MKLYFSAKLKDPRTDWRGILIITILAFLVAGINFYYLCRLENESLLLSLPSGIKNKEKSELRISRKSLSPREVVERFIEADMAGARLGGEIGKEAPSIEDYLGPNFYSLYDTAMVITKYEILEAYPFEDGKHHFFLYPPDDEKYRVVKVRYYCARGIGFGSMGINEEIKKGNFYVAPCDAYFKFSCPFCFVEWSLISHFIQFNLQEGTQTVTFILTKDKGLWKIDFSSIEPHISQETFEKLLKE